jgi:hypothetical protein
MAALMPNMLATVFRLMHKKSEAAIPMVLKRRLIHMTRMINATALTSEREQ